MFVDIEVVLPTTVLSPYTFKIPIRFNLHSYTFQLAYLYVQLAFIYIEVPYCLQGEKCPNGHVKR